MDEGSLPTGRSRESHLRFADRVTVGSRHRRWGLAVAATLTLAAPLVNAAPAHAAANAKAAPKLRILITDDDGPTTPGIDASFTALHKLPNVELFIVMPATNESGTGSSTTPGPHTGTKTVTPGGLPAYAVDGTPADTVGWALANMKRPQLVVSGVNDGQNLGAFTTISGTVGAARTAARAGIPALAVSQGLGNPIAYQVAAQYAVRWVKAHRSAVTKPKKKAPILFENLNVPTCTAGAIRGEVTVPAATTSVKALAPADCMSTMPNPPDDITAFVNGYAVLSPLTAG
jgi:5'-nucleotidase